jgi:hypothetical protein
MSETGDKLNAAYRALPRDEPRAAIDAAILAASRRALEKPSASRRWAAPVSIAAVLVLAFGVTLRMQQEKPGVESPDVYSSPPASATVATPAPEAAPLKQQAAPAQPLRDAARPQPLEKKVIVPAAKPDFVPPPTPKLKAAAPAQAQSFEEGARQRRDESHAGNEQKDMLQKEAQANVREAPASAPMTAAPPAVPPATAAAAGAVSSRAAPAAEMRLKREAVAADAQAPVDEPTRELEAIAKLRVEGRQEEADKALAEFRRKRPDYRIPDAMWERVKPR